MAKSKTPGWRNVGLTTIHPPGRLPVPPGRTFRGHLPPELEKAWVTGGNIAPLPEPDEEKD